MNDNYHIGIDIGGTNIRGGIVKGSELFGIRSERLNSQGSAGEILQQVYAFTDRLVNNEVRSIGIGVPGMVKEESGLIFDIVNIPAWKEIPLRQLMEERYKLPVYINNDANCFALGEYYFGKGGQLEHSTRQPHTMIGLTVGTGLGSGIIINGKLYAGANCGAGEFGMIDYLDQYIEYYASGQFFQNVYKISGEIIFERAASGDQLALNMFEEMGTHLGNAIKTILYALEADLIIIGGSVRNAWPYFQHSMWERVETFAYKRILNELRIEVSELENSGILGAAALHLNYK